MEPKDTSHTMQSINETLNNTSSSLITRDRISGTPFTIVGILEQGYRVIMGDYLMVEQCETKEECMKKLEENFWDVILRMTVAVVTRTIMEAAENKKDEKPGE